MRYTTYGSVRGMGPIRNTEAEAEADLRSDRVDCKRQGGYSDRKLAYVDDEGYLYHDPDCQEWFARSGGNGAVKV